MSCGRILRLEQLRGNTQIHRLGLFPAHRCVIWITIPCDQSNQKARTGGFFALSIAAPLAKGHSALGWYASFPEGNSCFWLAQRFQRRAVSLWVAQRFQRCD
jgi:hypothetical protein